MSEMQICRKPAACVLEQYARQDTLHLNVLKCTSCILISVSITHLNLISTCNPAVMNVCDKLHCAYSCELQFLLFIEKQSCSKSYISARYSYFVKHSSSLHLKVSFDLKPYSCVSATLQLFSLNQPGWSALCVLTTEEKVPASDITKLIQEHQRKT